MSEWFTIPLQSENLKSLIKRCEEKESQGWEFVTKIQKEFRPKDGITMYKVYMRKLNE
jgi:hypothetical protein